MHRASRGQYYRPLNWSYKYDIMANPKKDWFRAAKASGHYPLSFNFLFMRQDKHVQCSYCGRFIYEKRVTRDHVWPRSLGGIIKTPACAGCNIAKEDMKPIQWAVRATESGVALPNTIEED